jgi:hypothetical protein
MKPVTAILSQGEYSDYQLDGAFLTTVPALQQAYREWSAATCRGAYHFSVSFGEWLRWRNFPEVNLSEFWYAPYGTKGTPNLRLVNTITPLTAYRLT